MPQRYHCATCRDTGVVPASQSVKVCVCRNAVSSIDQAADVVLDWIKGRDPTYALRIRSVAEQGLDAKQILGRFCSYVLRNSLQNETSDDPLFAGGVDMTPEKQRCAQCRKSFKPLWPQQKYCGTACTDAARAGGKLPPSATPRPGAVKRPREDVEPFPSHDPAAALVE